MVLNVPGFHTVLELDMAVQYSITAFPYPLLGVI